MSDIINNILTEWSYRVHNGQPNVDNNQHITILQNYLIENNYPSDFISEFVSNLTEIKHVDNLLDIAIKNNKQNQTTLEKKEKAFQIFWNLYDKRHDYNKTKTTFMNLTIEQMRKAVKAVKPYVESTPDKTYRKTPRSWLLNKSWENEIVLDRKKTNRYVKPKYINNER